MHFDIFLAAPGSSDIATASHGVYKTKARLALSVTHGITLLSLCVMEGRHHAARPGRIQNAVA